MQEYRLISKRITKYILNLLALYVLGWGLTSFKSIFLGLILGTSLGLLNWWLLDRKMAQFSKAIDQGKTVRSLGFLSRVATAVFAIIISMEYPQYFHLISVVFGLMTIYFVVMIDYFLHQ